MAYAPQTSAPVCASRVSSLLLLLFDILNCVVLRFFVSDRLLADGIIDLFMTDSKPILAESTEPRTIVSRVGVPEIPCLGG